MIESDFLKNSPKFHEKLREIRYFEDLADDLIDELLALAKIRKYEKGETIIEEGAFDAHIFFLISGHVRVLKNDTELSQMRRLGDIFGEMAVIDGNERSASVMAISETLLLVIDGACLDRVKGESQLILHALLYKTFAEKLAAHLRDMNAENVAMRELLRTKGIPLPF